MKVFVNGEIIEIMGINFEIVAVHSDWVYMKPLSDVDEFLASQTLPSYKNGASLKDYECTVGRVTGWIKNKVKDPYWCYKKYYWEVIDGS